MNVAVVANRVDVDSVAKNVLNVAIKVWFVVTFTGQLIFAFAVASFYGLTAMRGDLHGWSKFISGGYRPGDAMGNLSIFVHVGSAAIVMSSGALQLVPRVRARFPIVHRYNGRFYILTTIAASFSGLYMTWFRHSIGDLSQHVGGSLNAVLIWLCAGMAVRWAMRRDFDRHRRWALRLFLVASAAWFYRLIFFLTLLVFGGPIGFDPTTLSGPFPTIMSFAQYLFPLAVLEVYFRARDSHSALWRMVAASVLFVLTFGMGVGILAVTTMVWWPDVKAGFDSRKSIAEVLSVTISSSGIEQAEHQYYELLSAGSANYNFDEGELNILGYQLIRKKQFKEAIRIFQLNVAAYPGSSNVYDSLAEAYLDDGDRGRAIVNYQKSVDLNPNNRGALTALRKLNAPISVPQP